MSVSRTIQWREDQGWVDGFFDQEVECEFPVPFVPRRNLGKYGVLSQSDKGRLDMKAFRR